METSLSPAAQAGKESTPVQAQPPAPRAEGKRMQVGATSLPALRIVEADGVTPCAAYPLQLLVWGAAQDDPAKPSQPSRPLISKSSCTTDQAGQVALARWLESATGAQLLQIHPAEPYTEELDPNVLDLAILRQATLAPTVLVLRELPTAPIRAQVVDKATGAAVPQFALNVHRWVQASAREDSATPPPEPDLPGRARTLRDEAREWVITDDQGSFTTRASHPRGELQFLTIESNLAKLQHDPETAETMPPRLEVLAGPVVRLDFRPGADRSHSDYVAGLWRAPAERLREDGFEEYSSPWSPDRGASHEHGDVVAVMSGDPPWVRFVTRQAEEPLPSFLYLVSRDGKSAGFARIESYEAHREVPLHVDLQERETLSVAVVWPTNEDSKNMNVDLHVSPVETPNESSDVYLWRKGKEPRTLATFPWLAAGAYRLIIQGEFIEPMELDVAVPTVEPLEVVLRSKSMTEQHYVAFEVETRTGEPLDGKKGRAELSWISMRDSDSGMHVGMIASIRWEADGGRSRPIELPAGNYSCTPRWERGGFALEPSTARFSVPGPNPRLVILDDVQTVWLELRVFDPPEEGGVQINGQHSSGFFSSFVQPFKPGQELQVVADGRHALVALIGPYDPQVELQLELTAEGYVHQLLSNARIPAANSEGRRVVELETRKGWSATLSVYAVLENDHDQRETPEGIVLTLDGIEQPPTDEHGSVRVEAPGKPRVLGVATEGWRLITRTSWDDWGSVFADTGEFTVEDYNLDVFLVRTNR